MKRVGDFVARGGICLSVAWIFICTQSPKLQTLTQSLDFASNSRIFRISTFSIQKFLHFSSFKVWFKDVEWALSTWPEKSLREAWESHEILRLLSGHVDKAKASLCKSKQCCLMVKRAPNYKSSSLTRIDFRPIPHILNAQLILM